MAVGKITGQMLGDSLGNLDRDGVDLAFDTDLIYLDVINRRVGIKNTTPGYELSVNGTTRSTNLEVTTTANIADITVTGNNIISNTGILNLAPNEGSQVVYQNKLTVDDIQIEGNSIRTVNSNANLELTANGTGTINLNSNVEIFGNLHATGTITADGNLTLGDADTDSIVFNAEIASDIIPDSNDTYELGSNTKRWNDVWVTNLQASTINTGAFTIAGIDIALEPGNTIYVSTNGSSSNSGTHPQDPVDSVGRAIDLAVSGDTIYIYPGTYYETLPLVVPTGVTIKGAGIRSVTIRPDSDDTVDMFLLNGETTIEDLTITGYKFDSGSNTGYAFKFDSGFKVTTRSPYIRNVSVITQGSVTSGTDPRGFDTGDAGKGAYLDGSVADPTSVEAACLFHSVTFICPGVDALVCTNGVRVEWLNSFTYFADRSFYAFSSSSGFAGDGKTRIKITNTTGTFNVGNVLSYYDVDGTTLLASGTIESIDGDFYVIDGRSLGFERLEDRDPKTVFANGNAALSTAQKKFGAASLALDGTGDYAALIGQADFILPGNFTAEAWIRPSSVTGAHYIFAIGNEASGRYVLFLDGTQLKGNYYGQASVTFGGTFALNTWYHVAIARVGTTVTAYVDGTALATTDTVSGTVGNNGDLKIGVDASGNNGFAGYIDDARICKGVAKYTGSFTAPTSALTGDDSTVLLLHFDGTNGSTTFSDDGVTLQDIRTSALGTASIIDFADYSDFGAEIRSIASASVYGNYGIYGDGVGVIGYFMSHNMGYIGLGKLSNNDPTYVPDDSTNVNEVVEINGAQIYYTTVDHNGDFRVGEFFYVNQRDGTVTFDQSNLSITSPTGITFIDGSDITELTPTYIQTGNIRISGNTIESIVNGLTLTAANNEITATSNVTVTGTLTVDDNFTVTGNTVIGDSNSDIVTFNAEVVSNFIPDTNTTYNLGSSANQWNRVYLSEAIVDDISISGNLIRTTVSNSNLELRANGTGVVRIDQLDFNDNNITSNLTNADININPNGTGTVQLQKDTYITGDLDVTGNITLGGNITIGDQNNDTINLVGSITNNVIPAVTATYNIGSNVLRWRNLFAGKAVIDEIEIDSNVIQTTISNQDLELRANGTGSIRIDQLDFNNNTIVSNTTNTDININPNGTGTVQLQKDTYITGDLDVTGNITLGGNITIGDQSSDSINLVGRISNNLIPSTTGLFDVGSNSLRWRNIYGSKLVVDGIEIDTNTIQTTESNSNLELRANGSGSIQVDLLNFKSNTISSNTTDTDININPNGTGTIQLQKDTYITGDLDVTGNITLGGNITIGNQSSDTINVVGSISNNLLPNVNGAFDIGSPSLTWRNLYAANLQINDIEINDNYIRTTSSNADLELSASGTGVVRITDNLSVDQNFTVSGTSTLANTTVNGTVTVTNLSVSNTVTASTFATGDIEIQGNVIRTVNSNSDLELRANGTGAIYAENLSIQQSTISGLIAGQDIEITPSGTGIVKINSSQSLQIPAGTDLQRPAVPTAGMIRYNSTINQYEGYNGSYWIQLGGITDVDRNTYILPELSPGSNENTIYFYANGTLSATLTATEFAPNKLTVDDLEINGNVIRTTTSNTDIEIRPNGTGAFVIDGFRFTSNTLLNTNSGATTEFRSTGNGYYKIVGTNAVVIPAGAAVDRPGPAQVQTGMIRFNTGLGFVEVYDGTTWGNIAGASSGITFAQAEDIALASALIFG